jgi:hypothetical protein
MEINFDDITWVTSFGPLYYENVAKYNLPGWSMLKGHKIALVDSMQIDLGDIKVIDAAPAYPPKTDMYYGIGGKKHKFWTKGKCFIWALRNVKTRYLIWLDSDVKILNTPDLTKYWPKDGDVASIICGNLRQAESGFVLVDRHHELFEQWLQKYEDAWYNGVIDTLHRPWDNDVLWYAVKDLPHRNLSKSVLKAPQGFEDTDLLDSFFHYSGKGRKHMVRE